MKHLLCLIISVIMSLSIFAQEDFSVYFSKSNIDNETINLVIEALRNMSDNKSIVFINAQKISQKGFSVGDFLLGWCYEGGEGTNYDPQKAVVHFLKAANANVPFPLAYQNLGAHYYQAIGVSQDVEKSFYWYKKGAENIIHPEFKADCICSLAVQYQNGEGVKQDLEECCRLYEIAANMGNMRAARNLSNRYRLGEGVVKNENKSFFWMEKAAELGDIDYQCLTGVIYFTGGVEGFIKIDKTDKEKGIYWLKKAAEGGSVKAMKAINDWGIK